ncbi:hypothetical protein ACH4S8_03855 [Streptomyces sp. NPDC021080]|uniref:hypothetical protein n=1 Tax=Streptomyces sp. NPDC021080 TaxID=3365110 RepID=UPI0037AA70FB
MSGEPPGSSLPPVRFASAWCATDLGEYRTCRHTYASYAYESLPPLDSTRFTGAFPWLGGTGAPLPEQVTLLGRLAENLAAKGLALPRDFVTFHTDAKLHRALDDISVTWCWTHISEPLPSPAEPGAYMVRFLRDQQDCVLWYLYFRPSGDVFVVFSHVDYADEYEARRAGDETGTDLDDPEEQRAALVRCAPTFEEFAYRFWIENHIWRTLHGDGPSGLDRRSRDYLNHYAPLDAPLGEEAR